jgi:hypothetical protein
LVLLEQPLSHMLFGTRYSDLGVPLPILRLGMAI